MNINHKTDEALDKSLELLPAIIYLWASVRKEGKKEERKKTISK